jgi:hypothetical protein
MPFGEMSRTEEENKSGRKLGKDESMMEKIQSISLLLNKSLISFTLKLRKQEL